MENNVLETMELVNSQKTYTAQLDSLLWGTAEVREVKGGKYIYLHKRVGGLTKTIYAGEYSEELYSLIQKNNVTAKEIKKKLRAIAKQLKERNYVAGELTDEVRLNIDFAKRNLVDTIYKQAVLEGVAVTFLDTETIIEGGKINGVSADDIQKINNLKHAWQFVLDVGVVTSKSDYSILCLINRLVEEGFYYNAGKLRSVPVSIGGTKWKPELPIESVVIEQLNEILNEGDIYESKTGTAFTYDEEKQLVKHCLANLKKDTAHAFLVLLYAGLRRSELASLNVIDGVWLECETSKERMGKNVVKRKIPITPMMKQVLPYIDFEKAKRVNLSTLQTTMKRLFPNHHSHELRHTFISRSKESGVLSEVVSIWAGHSLSGTITTTVYTHYSEEFQLREAEKVDYLKWDFGVN